MRKMGVLVAVALAIAMPRPAGAVWKGAEHRNFYGPDGAAEVEYDARASLVVDDHDFQDQIRGLVSLSNGGRQPVDFHVSYVKLVKSGVGTVRTAGSETFRIAPGYVLRYSTTWLSNPHGVYHSRLRLWACWPTAPGDPCGKVVVWNSGDVGYL